MGDSVLKKVPLTLATIDHCAVCVESTWRLEDSVMERVRVEEELGKEEFLVVYDKHDMATFYRGNKMLSQEPECLREDSKEDWTKYAGL